MQLKAVLDDTAGLPASVLSFYTKQNKGALKGKFVLNVEPVDGFELLDVAPLRDEEERLAAALEKKLVDDAITSAVMAAGGNVALLRPLIASRARLDRATLAVTATRDDGTPYYNNQGQPGTIEDIVADFKKDAALKRAFEKDPSESQSPGLKVELWGGKTLTEHCLALKAQRAKQFEKVDLKTNPFRRETFSLTDQMRISRVIRLALPNCALRPSDERLFAPP